MNTEVEHEGLTEENMEDFVSELRNGPADRVNLTADDFLSERVATFLVIMPKGLEGEALKVFKQEIQHSLEVIVRDAQMAIDSLEADAMYEIGRTL